MSRRGIFLTAFSLLIFSFPMFAQKKPEPPKKQQNSKSAQQELENKALKKWLDEDVAYIITDEEKAAFKLLKTDEEREQFIEQFFARILIQTKLLEFPSYLAGRHLRALPVPAHAHANVLPEAE